ncbi:Myeloid leukemia factor, partial [Arabidopsis suecica]
FEDEVVEDTGESQGFNLLNPAFVDFDTCLDPITNEIPTSANQKVLFRTHSQKERVERVRAILSGRSIENNRRTETTKPAGELRREKTPAKKGNSNSSSVDHRFTSASRAFTQKKLDDLKSLFVSLASKSHSNDQYVSYPVFQEYFGLSGSLGERIFDMVTQHRKDDKMTFEDLVIAKMTFEDLVIAKSTLPLEFLGSSRILSKIAEIKRGIRKMGDPFGGRFGGFRGSLFGGRDPFDDPFFSRPFEDLLEPSNTFSSGASFSNAHKNNGGRGLTIEELPSDEEVEERKDIGIDDQEHASSVNKPSVEHPEDDSDAERKIQNVNQRSDFNRREGTQSRANTFRHHICKVTYGGIHGAYYTSTRTRRKDGDGMVVEESKEADKTTGEATHRISRGINDKGHSVTRKLNSSGGVESTQTLHNLDEDELSGFEEAWKGNSSLGKHEFTGSDNSFGGWVLPSLDQIRRQTDQSQTGSSRSATGAKKVVRINIE